MKSQEFREQMRTLRLAKGLTYSDIGYQINEPPSSLLVYELGKEEMPFDVRQKVADLLGISI